MSFLTSINLKQLKDQLKRIFSSKQCIEIIQYSLQKVSQREESMSAQISSSVDGKHSPKQQIEAQLQEICQNLSQKYDKIDNEQNMPVKPNDKIKISSIKSITDKPNLVNQKKKTVKILASCPRQDKQNDIKNQLSFFKIRSNEESSHQELQRAPSLKKIRRNFSTDSNFEQKKLQESASSLMRKVKFQEIVTDDEQNEGDKKVKNFDANKFYEKLKIDGLDQSNKREEEQTFMSYICSLLRPQKRKSTKIQKRLMKLVELKTTGTKEQTKMLKCIYETLLSESIEGNQLSQRWKKLGFVTFQPLKQLQILVLLQWYNFTTEYRKQAIRLLNFCVEMDCSLFNFHKQATEVYCQLLEQGQIKANNWKDYQEYYNTLVNKSINNIFEKSKQSVANMQVTMIQILYKCGKNVKKMKRPSSQKVVKQKNQK